jgi:probable phosphoglycerate mutase
MSTIILTRHGQTEWNQVERFRGCADIPLDQTGLVQAQATSRRIRETWQPVTIYTITMSRAVKTGEIIAEPFGLKAQPILELVDIDYGQWQGLKPLEVKATWSDLYESWYRNPHEVQIPGGETLDTLHNRTKKLLDQIARRSQKETIVLVVHDSINRVILLYALGLGLNRYWNISQGTCAINVIETVTNDFVVVSMNETYHLQINKPMFEGE